VLTFAAVCTQVLLAELEQVEGLDGPVQPDRLDDPDFRDKWVAAVCKGKLE